MTVVNAKNTDMPHSNLEQNLMMQSQQARTFLQRKMAGGDGSLSRGNSGKTVAMVTGVAAFFAAAIRALCMTHWNADPPSPTPSFGILTEETSFYNGQ